MTKSANGFCSLIVQCNSLIDCFVKFNAKLFYVESESYVALNLRKFSQKRTITMQNRKKFHRDCPLKIVSIPKKNPEL